MLTCSNVHFQVAIGCNSGLTELRIVTGHKEGEKKTTLLPLQINFEINKSPTPQTYQEDAVFNLRISRVAHVASVLVLLVFDRRPFVMRLEIASFSTSGRML